MYNDEHFEYERIQNRTLRIEKLKLISSKGHTVDSHFHALNH